MRRLAAFVIGCTVACHGGNAERDDEAAKAEPERVADDGTVVLSDADRQALGLEVAAAEEGDLAETVLRFGKVRARLGEEALVVAPVSGRIDAPSEVELGKAVAAGAPLLALTPVLGAADRVSLGVHGAELEGDIATARKELVQREAEAARARDLAQSNIVSQAKLQEAETAVETTRARIAGLERAHAVQTRGEAGSITLRAPVDGTLVALEAPVGAVVQAGDVLARVLKPGPRWVDVAVPPEDAPGEGYEVGAGTGWLAARLVARGAVVGDDGSRHDRLEIDAADAASTLPGATVSVRVARGATHGVLVPESALVPGVGGDSVFVEVEDGRFASRRVQVAARFGGRARIATGLAAGERVVTTGAMALRGESLRGALEVE